MAILNVISTRNYEYSSYADYEYYPNEPEIIEIYLTYITRTRQIDSYPAAYVGDFGFKPNASIDGNTSIIQMPYRNPSKT